MSKILEAVTLVLGGTVRFFLVALSTWLITRGIIAPEDDFSKDAALISEIVGYLVMGGTIAWSWFGKVKAKRLANTRAALPAGTTEAKAKTEFVDKGKFASALTPADVKPVITDNSKKEKA